MKLLIFMMFILLLTSCFEGQEGLFNFESEFGCSKTGDCGKNALGENLKCYEGSCVVCIEGEKNEQASCGLNGKGYKTTVCVSNIWIDRSICEDPDECKEDEIRQNSCGLNNAGLTLETCDAGKWTANENDCINDDVCLNGEAKPASCGLNGNGTQQQFCALGNWINIGDCIDDDICTNTQTRNTSCGLNDNGIQNELCSNGQWENDGNCFENDVCKNDITRINSNSCGLNQNGYKNQICQNGQWIDSDSNCFDEDVCLNNTTKLEYNSCGVNGTGNAQKICQNGQWEDNQASITGVCDDNDVCRNGDLSQTMCENIGYMKLACVNGVNIPLSECKLPQIEQFGTETLDNISDSVTDLNGNIYITGSTNGEFVGFTNSGNNSDIFIAKYNNNFELVWLKQIGSAGNDVATSISFLSSDSNKDVYITGSTTGNLDGNTNQGGKDIFLTKYNTNGIKQWTRQWGTVKDEEGKSIIALADSGSNEYVFVGGITAGNLDGNTNAGGVNCSGLSDCNDVFLTKYNISGVKQWTKQIGSNTNDTCQEIISNASNIYITGMTGGSFNGQISNGSFDVYLLKYDYNGVKQLVKQFGSTGFERSSSISVNFPKNAIVLTGTTTGSFGKIKQGTDFDDIYILNYYELTNTNTVKQFEMYSTFELTTSIVDQFGSIFLSGNIQGSLDGNFYIGSKDAFIIKYDKELNKKWSIQWGSEESDEVKSININSENQFFAVGKTHGIMPDNQNQSNSDDYFITKFNNDLFNLYENKLYSCFENDCSGNGQCVNYLNNNSLKFNNESPNDATCLCDYGYVASGLNCISTNPDNQMCQYLNHGEGICNNIIDINGNYGFEIICDFGYIYNNGKCVFDKCFSSNSTCSDKGFCSFDGNENYCACEIGYKENTELLGEGDENPILCIENGFTKQINSENEDISSLTIDSENNIYILQKNQIYKHNINGEIFSDQFATSETEGLSIKIYNNNIYIVGSTTEVLEESNYGGTDAFLMKLNGINNITYSKQIGTSYYDYANDLAIDENENIFIIGTTSGVLGDGLRNGFGGSDIFISKFERTGRKLWTKQLGTAYDDENSLINIDSDNNIIIVYSNDENINILKYNSDWVQLWSKQYSKNTFVGATNIKTDNNDIYITGSLNNSITPTNIDLFILKLDSEGNQNWLKSFGNSSSETDSRLLIHNNKIYNFYNNNSMLVSGGNDLFKYTLNLAQLDINGNQFWLKKWDSIIKSIPDNIAINNQNELFIALNNQTGTVLQKITKACETGYTPNNDGLCVKLKGKSCSDEMITINSSGIYSNDTSIGYSDNFSNVLCSENALGNEVIYKLEITQPSTVTFKILNAEFNPIINIKQQCDSESTYNNNCSVSNELSSVEFEPGTYYVVIDGILSTDNGKFDLQVLFE